MKLRKKNATIHGVYASDAVLPWEDPGAFKRLFAALRAELKPDGALEWEIVRDLVVLRWRKRRIDRMMQAALTRSKYSEEVAHCGRKGFSGIEQALDAARDKDARMAEDYRKAVAMLTKSIESLESKLRKRSNSSRKLEAELRKLKTELARLNGALQDRSLVRGRRHFRCRPRGEGVAGRA